MARDQPCAADCFVASGAALTNNRVVLRMEVIALSCSVVIGSAGLWVRSPREYVVPMKAELIVARILPFLLCLAIVGAALDSLPDPPAIKPTCVQKNPIFRLIQIPASAIRNLASDCHSCRLQLDIDFTSATQIFERTVLPAEPLVLQAADASPPRRS